MLASFSRENFSGLPLERDLGLCGAAREDCIDAADTANELLLSRDTEEMIVAANEQPSIDWNGCRDDAFTHRILAEQFEFFADSCDEHRAVLTGRIEQSVCDDWR